MPSLSRRLSVARLVQPAASSARAWPKVRDSQRQRTVGSGTPSRRVGGAGNSCQSACWNVSARCQSAACCARLAAGVGPGGTWFGEAARRRVAGELPALQGDAGAGDAGTVADGEDVGDAGPAIGVGRHGGRAEMPLVDLHPAAEGTGDLGRGDEAVAEAERVAVDGRRLPALRPARVIDRRQIDALDAATHHGRRLPHAPKGWARLPA